MSSTRTRCGSVERIDVGLDILGDELALHRSLIWGLRYGGRDVTGLRSAVVRGHGQAAWVRDFPNQLQLAAVGIGAVSRNSKCVAYTGGWPHGLEERVWRLPPGAVVAPPFGYDETRTRLSAHVSALRKAFPQFMACPAGGVVPFAR
jgi:hypothetical protein